MKIKAYEITFKVDHVCEMCCFYNSGDSTDLTSIMNTGWPICAECGADLIIEDWADVKVPLPTCPDCGENSFVIESVSEFFCCNSDCQSNNQDF